MLWLKSLYLSYGAVSLKITVIKNLILYNFYGLFICRLSLLSNPLGSHLILLNPPCPPPPIQSPCALWITAHCSLLFIIENILKTGPTSLSLSLSSPVWWIFYASAGWVREHFTSHYITHSSALLLLKYRSSPLLSSSPFSTVPRRPAHLRPACPQRSPPLTPITENKLWAIYGSQQAGTNWIFLTEKKKSSIIMKLGKKMWAFDQFQTAAGSRYKYPKCSVGLSP